MKKSDLQVFYLLNIFTLICVVLLPFFRIDGGICDDTFQYVKIAQNLPNYTSSVWPVGYPIIIRIVNFFFSDFYITTKVIASISIFFIMAFSYYKDFFFKEVSVLLALKVFTIFIFSYSETLFLPFFFVLIYLIYNFYNSKEKRFSNILKISFTIILLCIIRYSSLFIFGAFFLLIFIEFLNKQRDLKIIKNYISIIIIATLGCALFLYLNFRLTSSFMGENARSPSDFRDSGLFNFILKNLAFSFLNAMNPIADVIRINKDIFLASVFTSLIFFIATIYFTSKILINKKLDRFKSFLFLMAISFFFGLIYSSFKTGIDGLHLRLILPIYFCIFFLVLTSYEKYLRWFLLVAFLSLIINVFFTFNESFNYLEKRNHVKEYLSAQKNLKYYYNDINRIPTETGGALTSNYFTVICEFPKIKVINEKELHLVNQKSVIRESDLVAVKPINRTFLIDRNTFSK